MMTENPDMVYDKKNKKTYKWTNRDAYAFGYLKNKLYISDWAMKHSDIDSSYKELPNAYERDDFKFPGRLWINSKMISFWKYPSPSKIESVFNDIKKEMKDKYKKDIGNFKNWKIEINVNGRAEKIISLEQFKNLGSDNIKQRSSKDMGQAHIISPVAKGKNKKLRGWGSDKNISGLSQTQYHQMKSTSENTEMKSLKTILAESTNINSVHYDIVLNHLKQALYTMTKDAGLKKIFYNELDDFIKYYKSFNNLKK